MKLAPFSSCRVRLLLLVTIALIPAFVMITVTGQEQRRLAREQAEGEVRRIADAAASRQQQLLDEARVLFGALAHLPQVRDGDPAACTGVLAQVKPKHYTSMGITERDGDVLCSFPPLARPVNVKDTEHYQRLMQSRDFAMSEYRVGRLTGKAVRVFVYPILDEEGQVQRMVGGGLDLAWVDTLGARTELPPGAVLMVLDRNGVVLARHPDPETWLGQSIAETPVGRAIQDAIQRGEPEGTFQSGGLDSIQRLYTVAAFDPQTSVAVGLPTALVYGPATRILVRNLLALGAVAVLALVAAWLGGDLLITRQARALVRDTQKLAGGNLSARSGPPYPAGEFGELGRAFDSMAGSLETLHTETRRSEDRATRLYQEAEAARRELEENLVQLKRAQETILGLSLPVLEVDKGILLLPLIGEMDARRAQLMNEQLLPLIRTTRARVLVMDITGLSSMDSDVVQRLVHTTEAARLLGAQVILTGVSAAVSRTLVNLGADLSAFRTLGDPQSGIAEAERLLREGADSLAKARPQS